MIVSIEGPDFVGKNTLVNHLLKISSNYFPNHKVNLLQFPNNETDIGRMCRKMLLTTDWSFADGVIFQLLNTAHRYEFYDQLKNAKGDKLIILFVIRYNLSGPVYASLDGLDATKTWNLYAWFDDVLPDMTLIIKRDYNFDDLIKERKPDHYEYEKKQNRVRRIYDMSDVLWGKKLGKVTHIKNINPKETVIQILEFVKKEMSNIS